MLYGYLIYNYNPYTSLPTSLSNLLNGIQCVMIIYPFLTKSLSVLLGVTIVPLFLFFYTLRMR